MHLNEYSNKDINTVYIIYECLVKLQVYLINRRFKSLMNRKRAGTMCENMRWYRKK